MLSKRWVNNMDYSLLMSVIVLLGIGLISIYSSLGLYKFYILETGFNQAIYVIIGILLILFISRLDFVYILNFSFYFYVITLLLLALTFVVGTTVNASTSWINLGFISFQPAEFAKLTTIFYLAYFFTRKSYITIKDVIYSLFIISPVIILILLQPDLGTALVIVGSWVFMVFTLNLRKIEKILLSVSLLLIIITSFALLYFNILGLKSYQLDRLTVYPDHLFLENLSHSNIGYQVDQSLISTANGGLFGLGLGNGSQTQYGFLPEADTDFIFSSIAEEMGIFGIFLILIFYTFIFWRIYMISTLKLPSAIYFLLVGLTSMIFIHIIQNIGMNLGLLPVTGIPLPFISLGGSFIIVSCIVIGVVESVNIAYKAA